MIKRWTFDSNVLSVINVLMCVSQDLLKTQLSRRAMFTLPARNTDRILILPLHLLITINVNKYTHFYS